MDCASIPSSTSCALSPAFSHTCLGVFGSKSMKNIPQIGEKPFFLPQAEWRVSTRISQQQILQPSQPKLQALSPHSKSTEINPTSFPDSLFIPTPSKGMIQNHQSFLCGIIRISGIRSSPVIPEAEQFPPWLRQTQLLSSLLIAMNIKWSRDLYLIVWPGCQGNG